ncbi:MAG: FHA domain-containing protein FhaB/FipA [Mycobacteriales bacterium]
MQALVLLLLKLGFLAALWLFVLMTVLAVRRDLAGRPVAARQAQIPITAPSARRPKKGRGTARELLVTEGPLAGTRITLSNAPVTIGRADDSTLVLSDDYVSSRHARLVPQDGSWFVEDVGSTNGTYLDRRKVTGPTPVPLGAQIRVGKTVLVLRR